MKNNTNRTLKSKIRVMHNQLIRDPNQISQDEVLSLIQFIFKCTLDESYQIFKDYAKKNNKTKEYKESLGKIFQSDTIGLVNQILENSCLYLPYSHLIAYNIMQKR